MLVKSVSPHMLRMTREMSWLLAYGWLTEAFEQVNLKFVDIVIVF